MANTTYPLAKSAILSGLVNLTTDTINFQAYDGAVYNAAHDFLNDVAGTKKGTAVTLTGKAVTGGRFTATVPSYTLTIADHVDAFVVYVDAGTDATRRLLAFIDQKADGSDIDFTATAAINGFTWSGPIFSIGGT